MIKDHTWAECPVCHHQKAKEGEHNHITLLESYDLGITNGTFGVVYTAKCQNGRCNFEISHEYQERVYLDDYEFKSNE